MEWIFHSIFFLESKMCKYDILDNYFLCIFCSNKAPMDMMGNN